MNCWVEETFHPHWRVRLEADEILHEVKTEHQHLVIFRNQTWGTVLMLDGVCQLTTLGRVHLPRDDGARAADGDGQAQARAGRRRRRRRRHARGLEASDHREGDAVRDRPHRHRHRAEVLPRYPRQHLRRRAHGRGHRGRPQVRRRDGRALRRHHRRLIRADRPVGGAAYARVLRRLPPGAEGGRHPYHAERPAVPVPRPPGADDARVRLAVRLRRARTCARSRATSAARSR